MDSEISWHEHSECFTLDNEAPARDARFCQDLPVVLGPCVSEVDLQGHDPPSVAQSSALDV